MVCIQAMLRRRSVAANAMLDPFTAMTCPLQHDIAPGAVVAGEQFSVGDLRCRTRGAQVEDRQARAEVAEGRLGHAGDPACEADVFRVSNCRIERNTIGARNDLCQRRRGSRAAPAGCDTVNGMRACVSSVHAVTRSVDGFRYTVSKIMVAM